MSPHQIIISVFIAHGLSLNLIAELETVLLATVAPQSIDWWSTPMNAQATTKYTALVKQISGPTAAEAKQRELVMKGLLLRLHGGNRGEADDAWERLTILMSRLN